LKSSAGGGRETTCFLGAHQHFVSVTKNEILTSLNKPEEFILAMVEFLDGHTHRVHYLRRPFQREPDFGVTSVNYDFVDLLARAGKPS